MDIAADGGYTDTNGWFRSSETRGGSLLSKHIHFLVTCNSTLSLNRKELNAVEGC